MAIDGKNDMKYNENHGLLRILNVAVGLVYAVSQNIKTDYGIINRATCIPMKIQYLHGNVNRRPSI